MWLKAGQLDDRNLGARVVVEQKDKTFYGVLASITDLKNGKTRLMFTDNETSIDLDNGERVDVNLAAHELAAIEMNRRLEAFLSAITETPKPQAGAAL